MPALGAIWFGARQANPAEGLVWVWVGLGLIMLGRAVTIMVPYLLQKGPFRKLADDGDDAGGAGGVGEGAKGGAAAGGLTLSWGGHKLKLA